MPCVVPEAVGRRLFCGQAAEGWERGEREGKGEGEVRGRERQRIEVEGRG